MLKTGSFKSFNVEHRKKRLLKYFTEQVAAKAAVPEGLKEFIFPSKFLSGTQYLFFPCLFTKAFKKMPAAALDRLCVSGYLYFKYLLCLDSHLDKDTNTEDENHVPENILVMRSHVYHEESVKMLAHLFPPASGFWQLWKQRTLEFTGAMLLDREYDSSMSFEIYQKLSAGKCSFLKASADAYLHYSPPSLVPLHTAIIKSLDLLAVGRCLQDDFEDFKKDILYKKNNYGHVLLQQWLRADGKNMEDYSPQVLEKYFYISKVAEGLLEKSKQCFIKAAAEVEKHKLLLPEFVKHIEASRNKSNFIKVQTESYRVTKMLEKIRSVTVISQNTLNGAVAKAASYIQVMQNSNGSWYEVSNKQGLSNTWSTAFIAMNLPPKSHAFKKAAGFLSANRQQGLWGYNTDWLPDFDTTTCSLMVLKKAGYNIRNPLHEWLLGQHRSGGFSTYAANDTTLTGYLGFSDAKMLKGWTQPHVCVSALAYYFLSTGKPGSGTGHHLQALKRYISRKLTAEKIWQPYWWTSHIYPTVFILKGLYNEGWEKNESQLRDSAAYLMSRQLKDGSFKCDTLGEKSVFYTAMVLDLLCSIPVLMKKYERKAGQMKDWLLTKQFENGSFENTSFLLIPNTADVTKSPTASYAKNTAGGTGSITGEIAGLFSTAVAFKALAAYQAITNNNHSDD
jgi:squalene-hopene/tetraprenyl-beta-curcumene cyclase